MHANNIGSSPPSNTSAQRAASKSLDNIFSGRSADDSDVNTSSVAVTTRPKSKSMDEAYRDQVIDEAFQKRLSKRAVRREVGEGQETTDGGSSPPSPGKEAAAGGTTSDGDDLSDSKSDAASLDINYLNSLSEIDDKIRRSSGSVSFLSAVKVGMRLMAAADRKKLPTTAERSSSEPLAPEAALERLRENGVGVGSGPANGSSSGGAAAGEGGEVVEEKAAVESGEEKLEASSNETDGGGEAARQQSTATAAAAASPAGSLDKEMAAGEGVAGVSHKKQPLVEEHQPAMASQPSTSALPPTPLPPPPPTFKPNYVEKSGWLTKLSHRKGKSTLDTCHYCSITSLAIVCITLDRYLCTISNRSFWGQVAKEILCATWVMAVLLQEIWGTM